MDSCNPKSILYNRVLVGESESGMVRSSSQSVLPLRPNLPQELLKKQQNEQKLVKHIMNQILKNSRLTIDECPKNLSRNFNDSNLINSPTCTNFQEYKLSSESTYTSDSNDTNNSLLKEIKNNNNEKKCIPHEPDSTFINTNLNESNTSGNKNIYIKGRKELSDSSCNSNRTFLNSDEYNDEEFSPFQRKKEDSRKLFHMKIQSEKDSNLSESCVINDEDFFFKPDDDEKDKNNTIKPNEPLNTNVKLISKSCNFQSINIDLKDKHYLGRNNEQKCSNFILCNSLVVSRHHAELFIENNDYYIRDVGSNGGTFINGKRISKPGHQSEAIVIYPGDTIQLGQDYIENDKDKKLDESVYKCVIFEIVPIKSLEDTNRETIDKILDVYDLNNLNSDSIVRTQSDMQLNKRISNDFNDDNVVNNQSTKMTGKTDELYFSELLDESTQYQLELYEKTKDLNDEYSNINSHLLDNVKKECLQYFFVVYSDKKKLNKIQILNYNTECIFEISLKDWLNKHMKFGDENKGKMQISDKRDEFSPTSSLKIFNFGDRVNIHAENYQIGYIENVFDMKYIVKTPEPNDNGLQFCFTGDFEQQNWLCIVKFKDSRKQRCIGEAKGKQLVEKSTKFRKWVISVQLETGNYSQLLLSAVAYIIAITGPYY